MFNAARLARMKPSAYLINTARGGIVDESALFTALSKNHIASAAFDVFENEPWDNEEFKKLPNFYFTPHIGGSAIEAVHAMGVAAIEGLSQGKTARVENFFDYPL